MLAAGGGALAAQEPATGSAGAGIRVQADGPERRAYLEVRGGAFVPTGGVSDGIDSGIGGGLGFGVRLGQRFWLMGDADLGRHELATVTGGPATGDINVYHFMGKVGVDLLRSDASRWSVVLNAGAGAMQFDFEDAANETHFAINAGLKIAYSLGERAAFVLSPQGDIAFADEGELGSDTIFIWPFTAGFRFTF
jgi:hypothetical protein